MEEYMDNLFSLLDFLKKQRDDLQLENRNLSFQIDEIDKFLKTLFNREDEDAHVFSPRNVNLVFQEQIRENEENRKKLEEDQKQVISQMDSLSQHIDFVKNLLNSMKQEEMNASEYVSSSICLNGESDETEVDFSEQKVVPCDKDLVLLSHQLRRIAEYVRLDHKRAELELKSIAKGLDTKY